MFLFHVGVTRICFVSATRVLQPLLCDCFMGFHVIFSNLKVLGDTTIDTCERKRGTKAFYSADLTVSGYLQLRKVRGKQSAGPAPSS